ncbi:hypothetical protein AAEX37_01077 [Oligella sp. MSHR50489EDL]|uniref:hypothetical protein n=1 Tax=Oligella sp. MSHR50489EDL TaxID=3139409 RepID=UPI003D816355
MKKEEYMTETEAPKPYVSEALTAEEIKDYKSVLEPLPASESIDDALIDVRQ